jgi:hypothetical protein
MLGQYFQKDGSAVDETPSADGDGDARKVDSPSSSSDGHSNGDDMPF